jgi:hypothetical protein
MLLTDGFCTSAVQVFHVFTICHLERSKYCDITRLKLVGRVGWKAAENDVVVMTKLHDFKGLVRAKSIISQDPWPTVCAMFGLGIKHLTVLFEHDCGV